MNEYLFILPAMYTSLFISLSILKNLHKSLEKLVFCTTCISFFLGLLIGFGSGFPPIILSMMMGLSITGIAYKIKQVVNVENGLIFFISELMLTILGLIVILLFLD